MQFNARAPHSNHVVGRGTSAAKVVLVDEDDNDDVDVDGVDDVVIPNKDKRDVAPVVATAFSGQVASSSSSSFLSSSSSYSASSLVSEDPPAGSSSLVVPPHHSLVPGALTKSNVVSAGCAGPIYMHPVMQHPGEYCYSSNSFGPMAMQP